MLWRKEVSNILRPANPEHASRFGLIGDNKMKRVLAITFAVFAMAAIAFGADNTLGTWKRDTAKSKSAPGVSPITNETLTREAVDGG